MQNQIVKMNSGGACRGHSRNQSLYRGDVGRTGRPGVVRRAFTLIEVLIVLVLVLAILSIVAVNLMPKKEEGIRKTVQIQLKTIESALEQFDLDMGRYPTQDEGLDVLWDKTKLTDEALQSKHPGNYFKGQRNLKDYWGHPFNYLVLDSSEIQSGDLPYKVWSDGPDGQSDTADDIYPSDQKSTDDSGLDAGGSPDGGLNTMPGGGGGSGSSSSGGN